MKNNLDRFAVFLILLSFVLALINVKAIGFMRFSEILVLISFFLVLAFFKKNVNLKWLVPSLLFFISLMFSALISILSEELRLEVFFGFYYKYIFLFINVFLAFYLSIKCDSKLFNRVVLFVFVTMAFWAIFYSNYLGQFVSTYYNARIAFPALSFEETDAHLFSFCFGFLSIYCFLFVIEKKMIMLSVWSLVSLYVLLMTGSRSGLLLWGGCLSLYFFRIMSKGLSYNGWLLLLISILPVITLGPILLSSFDNDIVSRALNFSFDDSSSIGRLGKASIALEHYANGPLIFGRGAGYGDIIWYDGILSILILHSGLIGVVLYVYSFLLMLYMTFVKNKKINFEIKYSVLIAFCYVFFGLLITEYVLVSRGATLVLVPLLYMVFNVYSNRRECENNSCRLPK